MILGVIALMLAVFLLLKELGCDPGSGGFAICLGSLFYTASAILAGLGLIGVLYGRYMIREARELREFNEAMELNNRRKKD